MVQPTSTNSHLYLCTKQSIMQLLQKKFTLTLIILLAFQVSYGQKVTRDVGSFDGVNLSLSANMYLTQGNSSSVVIEGPQEAIDHIETKVRDGVLIIKQDEDWKWWKSWNNKNVRIYITNPSFEQVSVSGSGNIKGENTLQNIQWI